MTVKGYAKFLLIMAGLGGLLYGVDVGVIAAALPYIERTSTFNQAEIGWIVGMALWGSPLWTDGEILSISSRMNTGLSVSAF